jgi:hypothetical protein
MTPISSPSMASNSAATTQSDVPSPVAVRPPASGGSCSLTSAQSPGSGDGTSPARRPRSGFDYRRGQRPVRRAGAGERHRSSHRHADPEAAVLRHDEVLLVRPPPSPTSPSPRVKTLRRRLSPPSRPTLTPPRAPQPAQRVHHADPRGRPRCRVAVGGPRTQRRRHHGVQHEGRVGRRRGPVRGPVVRELRRGVPAGLRAGATAGRGPALHSVRRRSGRRCRPGAWAAWRWAPG